MQNSTLEIGPGSNAASPQTSPAQKQRRTMLGALALLLLALILVLAKDWDFWFPPESADVDTSEQAPRHHVMPHVQAPEATKPPVVAKKARHTPHAAEVAAATPAPVVTTTNRAVLPPLEIEVVAGDQHQPAQPANNSVKVDVQDPSAANGAANGVENAAARVTLSPATAGRVSRSVDPSYPLLAKQMKVQGSVVLQAIIGASGNIEDLRVVSGPSILSDAARQAVRQWRFKPYYQEGQPVETEARITVNFTISTY